MDLYATAASTSSAEPFDLRSMRRLPELTGGRLRLYPSPGESNAPQDVFAALKEPVALNATLRMRTSNEFDVSGVFGGLVEDPRYPQLYHLAACGPHACFAFDFKFTGSGFSREPELKPTVQLAFRYEVFAPVHGKAEAEGEDKGEGREYAMQRRLRVYTKQFPVAKSALDLYEGADAHATICVLVHKLARVVEDQGFQEARALCEDWLINLLGEYNLSLNRRWEKEREREPGRKQFFPNSLTREFAPSKPKAPGPGGRRGEPRPRLRGVQGPTALAAASVRPAPWHLAQRFGVCPRS